mmetsp:Transcript_23434/g.60168  ORF Transcript_23434/g.60168 Transcript_23434/m.60168 type:complete len:219 (+) Transcript_23434:323-979(+)
MTSTLFSTPTPTVGIVTAGPGARPSLRARAPGGAGLGTATTRVGTSRCSSIVLPEHLPYGRSVNFWERCATRARGQPSTQLLRDSPTTISSALSTHADRLAPRASGLPSRIIRRSPTAVKCGDRRDGVTGAEFVRAGQCAPADVASISSQSGLMQAPTIRWVLQLAVGICTTLNTLVTMTSSRSCTPTHMAGTDTGVRPGPCGLGVAGIGIAITKAST